MEVCRDNLRLSSLVVFRLTYCFFFVITLASVCLSAQAENGKALSANPSSSQISLPKLALEANELGLIVNIQDPLSMEVAEYYQKARHIPDANIIRVSFSSASVLSPAVFEKIKSDIDRTTPAHVQGYAISWTQPYRVGCMSITSAIAMGYDTAYCQHCKPTKQSEYFNSPSRAPFTDHKIRPAMMLAGDSFTSIKAMIDKGVASDYTMPEGNAYLLSTSDKNRNVRALQYEQTKKEMQEAHAIYIVKANEISFKQQVMFYFTGAAHVKHLHTVKFLPGAMADHLTSSGGVLVSSPQMSALKWLEAGATASYGTVVEPCNYPQKFPSPPVAMYHYMTGASLLEAYWKSVAWPGEGVFVGEPLAKPYSPIAQVNHANTHTITMYTPQAISMALERAQSVVGPYETIGQYAAKPGLNKFDIKVEHSEPSKLDIDNTVFRLHW